MVRLTVFCSSKTGHQVLRFSIPEVIRGFLMFDFSKQIFWPEKCLIVVSTGLDRKTLYVDNLYLLSDALAELPLPTIR